MATISVSEQIQAPAEKVFALFTDLDTPPGRIKAIKKIERLTNGPVGVGTRFRETRVMFGKEATEEMEFVEFDRPRGFTLGAESCGARYRSVFRFTPEGSGTRVTLDFNVQPVSFLAKLFAPLTFLMKGMMTKCIRQDIDDLKAIAEKG